MMISRGWLTMLLGVCAGLGSVSPAGAVVRYVDDDAPPDGDGVTWATAYDSPYDALAAAQPGDQVWVAAGRYMGRFTLALGVELYGGFAGTETELAQRDWVANPTILDGNAAGSVVTGTPGATATTRIDGFTITNGLGNLIQFTFKSGGGIYLAASSPTIANNTIMGNTAELGGGVYLESSAPVIANSTIRGNDAQLSGGGLYSNNSSPTIVNSTISGNSVADRGGAACLRDSYATIVNNTITGNRARFGGGLDASDSFLTMVNTIVAFNSSGIDGFRGTITLRNNCVFGNFEYDYRGLKDPSGTDGNVAVDPLFADLCYGNVHIQPASPCVDGGSNDDTSGGIDMDGEGRIQPVGGTVDIGADESDGSEWASGPYAVVRVSMAGDDFHNGSSWELAKRTVQAGIDAASALGGEVWVEAGTYAERITLHPYAYVYGGFSGDEGERDARDWVTNVTTLDGQQKGSIAVVTARAGDGVSTIDGFTITNGAADYGGGLYVSGSSPAIRNNTITGNEAREWGGGLALFRASPSISNNLITDNRARSGGGVFVVSSAPTIVSNTIMSNTAELGGGIKIWKSSPTVSNNTIQGNEGSDGGGLAIIDGSSPTISNNIITGNSSVFGGGIYVSESSATIVNNTISSNVAVWDGGALYVEESAPTVVNTVFAFNSPGVVLDPDSAADSTLWYNCVYGNMGYDYSGVVDPTGTDGNISVDPRFVRNPDHGGDGWGDDPNTPGVDEGANDDYGDVQLLSGSPCIDAGDNVAVPIDRADLDGDGIIDEPLPIDLAGGSRFVDDPRTADTGSGTPPIVDMGAYERLPGDCRGDGGIGRDGNVDLLDYAGFEACAGGAADEPTGQCECLDLDGSGEVGLLDFAVFQVTFSGG